MKLWIFGDSLSLPYHLDSPSQGWPEILAEKLNCEYKNFSQPAADNFFIYNAYQYALTDIKPNDIVVVGWSHPSRKSFVFDQFNPLHTKSLEYSFVYETDIKFIRSKNQLNDTLHKWEKLIPVPQNKPFYDIWYRDYYSEREQKSNLFAYQSSVAATCPSRYVQFFFSNESIQGTDIQLHAGTMLEFIKSNACAISAEDSHLNVLGHQLWAEQILTYLKNQQSDAIFPVIELIDRYTIAKLKFFKTGANLEEIEFYNKQLSCYNLDSVAKEINELYQVHCNIWELEADLKSGQEYKISFEELGKRAVSIRNHNHHRISLKNKIAEIFGDTIREIKKDHLSQ